MTKVRVRFAPSPTGPLHIGGVRTALYNYLLAKQSGGSFILRIEDTDQVRYVPGAEEYIMESLNWLGLTLDEGPGIGGAYGPYRQSERKDLYASYVQDLIDKGHAYYAFDTPEELDQLRSASENDSFKYGIESRMSLKNSLTLSKEEVDHYITLGHYAVRLHIPADQEVVIEDEIRGTVTFKTNELDDKVIMKGDGMPTYHLANIVDDHLMEISHVIRGEEWLSSTAHHILMYQFFGWQAPRFAHLPLILKPTGQGKLSKRDGAKFGFPVFPITWNGEEEQFPGFREDGFLPEALLNFLVLLGWNPGNDQEILTKEEMISMFSIEKIVKSGARFDFDKAKWLNQQYILNMPNTKIAALIKEDALTKGYHVTDDKLIHCAIMMKERVHKLSDILNDAYFLFEDIKTFDIATFDKKYKPENKIHLEAIGELIGKSGSEDKEHLDFLVKDYINNNDLKMGDILPILRIALTGTMQGPDLFETMSFLGRKNVVTRISTLINKS
jgi:glutamyl-tRNA synthetase